MQVWLPDRCVTRWSSSDQWAATRRQSFPAQAAQAERFWRNQEQLADISWRFAARYPPMPPATTEDLFRLAATVRPEMARLLPHIARTVGHELRRYRITDRALRTFIDAQLLISAQVLADECAWLFGSVALDLARQGVFYVEGGAWTIARTLVDALLRDGGEIHYRTWGTRILTHNGRAAGIQTSTGEVYHARHILANLTPWDVQHLLDGAPPPQLRQTVAAMPEGWGAFMLYLGVDEAAIPAGLCDHHQVILDYVPLGEGNSLFLSLHPPYDTSRAPVGQRALTVSTHTRPAQWWEAKAQGRAAYNERKVQMIEQMLRGVARVLPDVHRHIRYQQSGTPVTFHRYTRRANGMVGGMGQRPWQSGFFSLGARALHLPGLWLVGDSTFPGQSSAAVTQSGIRVWQEVRRALRSAKSRG